MSAPVVSPSASHLGLNKSVFLLLNPPPQVLFKKPPGTFTQPFENVKTYLS